MAMNSYICMAIAMESTYIYIYDSICLCTFLVIYYATYNDVTSS